MLDDEGAEAWNPPDDPGSPGEFARQLSGMARQILEAAGHRDCPYLGAAVYVPESSAVVCGCGEFEEAPELQDDPPVDVMVGGHVPYQAADPIRSALALINPTEVYSPEQVERHILDTLYRLETGALFERHCIERASAADAAFNRMYFATIHTTEQTSELKRKAEAEVACEQAGLTAERDEAKMILAAVKATMHNLRAVLSGYQSTAKSVTAAYQTGGSAGRF